MSEKSTRKISEQIDTALKNLRVIGQPFIEIYYGVKTRTLNWEWCVGMFAVSSVAMMLRVDIWLFRKSHLILLYPKNPYLYWPYFFVMTGSGFLAWAGAETMKKRQLVTALGEAFRCAGLCNKVGRLPGFIFDRPLDSFTRKLKVTNARLPLDDFRRGRATLESALQIYVDDIKEERTRGTVEITYSHFPMPEVCQLKDPKSLSPLHFVVGHTRTREVKARWTDVPHLLVAGQTSSGKSTFLRQLITTTYLNNESCGFTLIDLKEGLEFQLFEHLPRVVVISQLSQASLKLGKFHDLLERRMKVLKANKCKDLSAYFKLPKDKRVSQLEGGEEIDLNRHLIVIDEAADLFLAGGSAATGDIQKARRVLVDIARKGRAVGLHLIFATQRPDARSIDAQVKANLPGILCFQMPNDASSMIVLGSGRATDLPPIAGRAIWKAGSDMMEIQTPLMTTDEAEELLKPYRKEDAAKEEALTGRDLAKSRVVADESTTNSAYERA